MRVEVVESLPAHEGAALPAAGDAGVERALRGFLAAVDSDDSLFACQPASAEYVGGSLCAGDFVLRFRGQNLRTNRRIHFSLVEKLVELLGADGSSGESLVARICLLPEADGMALQLRLQARGNSAEQAGLRWGLGVAHVQQALLFTSRYLRQQIAQTGD
jgi:hypothetical protein